jgi:hypothetical protein
MARLDLHQHLTAVVALGRDQAASRAGSEQLATHAKPLGCLG